MNMYFESFAIWSFDVALQLLFCNGFQETLAKCYFIASLR